MIISSIDSFIWFKESFIFSSLFATVSGASFLASMYNSGITFLIWLYVFLISLLVFSTVSSKSFGSFSKLLTSFDSYSLRRSFSLNASLIWFSISLISWVFPFLSFSSFSISDCLILTKSFEVFVTLLNKYPKVSIFFCCC